MSSLKHNFGTDPEVFVYKELIKTEFGNIPIIIPPAALIEDFNFPFEMIEDKKVLLSGKTFQWSEDGAAIEMQTAPTKSANKFVNTIGKGIITLKRYLAPHNLKVWINPLGYFDIEKYWKNRGEEFRMCVIFGCDPDEYPEIYYDLGLEENKETQEIDVSNHPYRYGGAHVHIQAPKSEYTMFFKHKEFAPIIFDFLAGMLNTQFKRVPSVILAEKARLIYYGRPGRFRLQTYDIDNNIFGFEYRVMSNSWLGKNSNTMSLLNVLDLATLIIQKGAAEKFVKDHEELIPEVYRTIIELDQANATEILVRVMSWLLKEGFVCTEDISKTFKVWRY